MINPAKVFEVEEDVRAEVEARIGCLIAEIETLQGKLNDAKDLICILAKIHDPLILQYSIRDCIKMLSRERKEFLKIKEPLENKVKKSKK